MSDTLNTAEAARPRLRWYQVRLRTLLIGVVLLSIPLAYAGWEAKIVRERRRMQEWITQQGGTIYPLINAPPKDLPPVIRRLLGDKPIGLIELQNPITTEELRTIEGAFPEADIIDGKRVTGPATGS